MRWAEIIASTVSLGEQRPLAPVVPLTPERARKRKVKQDAAAARLNDIEKSSAAKVSDAQRKLAKAE